MTDFQINEFRTYEVRVEGVNFGFINTVNGGYSPAFGEQFQYDGTTVILKDGREFADVPQLRSAVRENWCVPVGGALTVRRPKSAGIEVRATTQMGSERVVKTMPRMERAEEDVVVVVEDRKRRREAINEGAVRRVPLESAAARQAMAAHWASGDDTVDEIAGILTDEMDEWLRAQEPDEPEEEFEDSQEEKLKARAEASILSLFALVDEDEDEALKSRSRARRAEKSATQKGAPRAPRPLTSSLPATVPSDLRTLPVDAPEGEHRRMPIVREDVSENSGKIVGNVEREREFTLDLVPARPAQSPRPSPRFGGAGAIIVDEQRHVGDIVLSGGRAPIQLDESAKVRPTSTESIKMGDVQVGDRRKVARTIVETDQGITVGRILSPTHQDFVADERNTSASAIVRAQEGRQVRIEKFEIDGDEDAGPRAVATGDVQEARSAEDLEELLPDAAQGPKPVVHRRPEEDPAYAAVKVLIPEFEWNKDRQVKERVADALTHYKTPMYLKGILAVETEIAREAIKKGLAELLAKKTGKKTGKKAGKKAG
jgi:hypothetical protein